MVVINLDVIVTLNVLIRHYNSPFVWSGNFVPLHFHEISNLAFLFVSIALMMFKSINLYVRRRKISKLDSEQLGILLIQDSWK